MKTVSFVSLGCRVNQYEIQSLREDYILRGYDVVPFGKECDICVINTCAVTKESEKKSLHTISRAERCAKRVIVTGCYAELCNIQNKIPRCVFYCGGSRSKSKIPDISETETQKYLPDLSYDYGISIGRTSYLPNDRYRAYVKIQDGCNGKCSYCIISKLRYKSSVRAESDILDEVKRLCSVGVTEIIFTGIEISNYGASALCSLIKKTAEIPEIRRIRLGSINPNSVTDDFADTVKNTKKCCKHIHLSVQSASNDVLSKMLRPYSEEKLISATEKLISIPDIMLSADIIAGFPTESDDDFEKTVTFAEKYNLMHIHAFPYSPRPFTEAANMEQIPDEIKKNRTSRLIKISANNRKKIALSLIGKEVEILIEKNSQKRAIGHTDNFLEAEIIDTKLKAGTYVKACVTGYDEENQTLICKQEG